LSATEFCGSMQAGFYAVDKLCNERFVSLINEHQGLSDVKTYGKCLWETCTPNWSTPFHSCISDKLFNR